MPIVYPNFWEKNTLHTHVVEATVNTHATTPVDFRMEQRTSVPAAGGSSGILDKNKCWKQRELVDQTGKVSSVTAKDNLNGLI